MQRHDAHPRSAYRRVSSLFAQDSSDKKAPVTELRILCVAKARGLFENPHHAIRHLGWFDEKTGKSGKSTRLQIYDWIKTDGCKAYVQDAVGQKHFLVARESADGLRYVQTFHGQHWTADLLLLADCLT